MVSIDPIRRSSREGEGVTWLRLPSAKPLCQKAVILKAYVSVLQAVYDCWAAVHARGETGCGMNSEHKERGGRGMS